MIPKRLEEVLYSDIEGIISSELREGKTVDYKRDLPGNSENEKKEFLYDVSSFANTVGGDLIIGLEEENGVASKVTAVTPENLDKEIQRIDSILMSGIEPRIRYHMRAIPHPKR
jgi:predicted HTH transcriptional regulator